MTWRAVTLADLTSAAECDIGGKAAGVAALRAADLAVPDGFVVCSSTRTTRWGSGSSALVEAVTQGYAALADRSGTASPLVAVRSSSAVEDGEHHSAAGLLPTELGLRGSAAVAAAVSRVSVSGAALVREYAGDPTVISGPQPVLVQMMVSPALAGVSFSAHPVTGARDRILVEAVHGLGVLLTDGQVVPMSATIERASGRVVAQRAGRQPVAARLTAAGGVELGELAAGDAAMGMDTQALEAIWAATVAAERVLGLPVDLEWAIDDAARLWLLQARPITTLPD